MAEKSTERRNFLKIAAAGSAAVAGLRFATQGSASQSASTAVGESPHKWAMMANRSLSHDRVCSARKPRVLRFAQWAPVTTGRMVS
jgi:anaerobic selenocysteine-containing dehydrogenase